jgi:hypothetical protein
MILPRITVFGMGMKNDGDFVSVFHVGGNRIHVTRLSSFA